MDGPILHLAPADRWEGWPPGEAYLPDAYEADGFVHCTAGDALMLTVANRFYRDTAGPFVALSIDPARLTAPLRWEAATDAPDTLFPHLYGAIDAGAVVGVRAMLRDDTGAFVGYGPPQ